MAPGAAAAPATGSAAPLRTALTVFEAQLDSVLGTLENKVLDSQQQTFDHLLLYEGAVQELQSTAKEAACANDELSAACEALEASSVDVEPALLRLLALSELTKKLVAGVAKLDDI